MRQLVAVEIVAKVERVQLGRVCRKQVIFVALNMSNVLSTFGRLKLSNSCEVCVMT